MCKLIRLLIDRFFVVYDLSPVILIRTFMICEQHNRSDNVRTFTTLSVRS